MLNRDLLRIERDAVRQATGVLTAANDASESNEQRDARARDLLAEIVDSSPEGSRLDDDSFDAVIQAGINDLYYLGPIEELLPDTTISEIMVNAPDDVWVERAGLLQKTPVTFEDDEHVKFVINRIASADGRRCDEAQPLCDCILNRPGAIFNGSRVAATAKGIAVDHNILNIRKFRPDAVEPEDLMALGTFDQRMLEFMEAIVLGRMNVVIAGGTGSGKTTLLNACSSFIPDNQRIVTIEDAPELRLQKPHVVRKTARRPNIEGEGEITIRQLVIHALRERPATTRLRSMIQQTGTEMRSEQIMELIASAIDFIVFVNRFDIDGSRKITEIAEVQGMQGDVITIGTIMRFEQTGFSEDGKVLGEFMPTGERITPAHREKLFARGVYVDDDFWFRR